MFMVALVSLLLGCAPDEGGVAAVEDRYEEVPAVDPMLCDGDLDGFGVRGEACLEPGLVDCDDADQAVHPGAEEVCDGRDEDCSGAADDPFDHDGDGQAGCAGDCDDWDARRSSLLVEVCDGIDNDCDRGVDELFDLDEDGVATCRGDCRDDEASVHPGLEELCDGLDNDCDPYTSEDGDLDGDGMSLCQGDCNDADARVRPGLEEVCDRLDNDCDGVGDSDPACFDCTLVLGVLVCGQPVTWHQADDACQAFSQGLVMPDSEDANDLVALATAAYGYTWIGLTDEAVEGYWDWLDGSPLTWQRWWAGEPNDAGGEDCAGTNFGAVGWWNDFSCATALPFACRP